MSKHERPSGIFSDLHAEEGKVRTFALFAGGVVQALSPDHRLALNIEGDGVLLPQAERGSSFADLGRAGAPTK